MKIITESKLYQEYVVYVESKALGVATKREYLRHIRRLAKHYPNKTLKQITEAKVFDYLIYLREVDKFAPDSQNQALVSLRMFYRDFLGRDWKLWNEFSIKRKVLLPEVLSRSETRAVLHAVSDNRFKAIFYLIYHCGLRIGEAIKIEPGHIDGQRRVLRVHQGKGGKDREVPLSEQMLIRLRAYWKFHGNSKWLFPAVGQGWKGQRFCLREVMANSSRHISKSSVQQVMRLAVKASGIKKQKATCHTLRHSFATHLLEEGVSIRQVSSYLGHSSLNSTLIYLHVTEMSEAKGRVAQEALLNEVLK